MLRIGNIRLSVNGGESELTAAVLRKCKLRPEEVRSIRLARKSVDARDKGDIHYVVTADVEVNGDENELLKRMPKGLAAPVQPYIPPVCKKMSPKGNPPVVVGLGPGGLFAALTLARAGLTPLVLERGQRVEMRRKTVDTFFSTGELDENSNIQFGEGGAGAFSDGKLTTGIKDKRCREVLETLVAFGAPKEILYEGKPHIGTDRLPLAVSAIRREIERLGGQVRFGARLSGVLIEKNRLCGIVYEDAEGAQQEVRTESLILSIGHSASDTQQMLFSAGVNMVQKPFSVGARIEHPQQMVNRSQYGIPASEKGLPPAEYHLSAHLPSGRGVYTFCMCPGGEVVGAASRKGGVCVNGCSNFLRDGENANSALLIDVRPEDFPDEHPLSGYVLQRMWEERAFRAGGGGYHAPCQRVDDFLLGRDSNSIGEVKPTYLPGVTMGNLSAVLPEWVIEGMRAGIKIFDRQLHGFARADALLTGVETRSSCPVRVPRDETGQCNIEGVFPCGEGAGYAGGIMSAGVDGIRQAENVMKKEDSEP